MTTVWATILVASFGCYGLKLAGVSLPQSVLNHPTVQRTAGLLPVAMLTALVVTDLFDASGRPREHWLHFLGDLADYPADQVRNRFTLATRHIRDTGVTYRVYGEENERSWPINPVPLILGHA